MFGPRWHASPVPRQSRSGSAATCARTRSSSTPATTPAYTAYPDDQTLEAIGLAGRPEGMIIAPVYEGESLAGLIDLVANGEIDRGSNVPYAHLGGQPALNAYGALFTGWGRERGF